jgi:hypothetical protein
MLDKLRNVIQRAFKKLLENDSFLLENDLHERAISHWFAVYLNDEIQDSFRKEKYNVDYEYNRDITRSDGRVKKAFLLRDEINAEFKNSYKCKPLEYFGERSVYPDIIVHKRGSNADNLLVLEIKKEYYNIENQTLVSHGTFASSLLLLSSQFWAAPKSTRFEASKVYLQATIFSSLHKFLIWMLRYRSPVSLQDNVKRVLDPY